MGRCRRTKGREGLLQLSDSGIVYQRQVSGCKASRHERLPCCGPPRLPLGDFFVLGIGYYHLLGAWLGRSWSPSRGSDPEARNGHAIANRACLPFPALGDVKMNRRRKPIHPKFGGGRGDCTPDRVRARCRGFVDHPIATLASLLQRVPGRENASKTITPCLHCNTHLVDSSSVDLKRYVVVGDGGVGVKILIEIWSLPRHFIVVIRHLLNRSLFSQTREDGMNRRSDVFRQRFAQSPKSKQMNRPLHSSLQ